MWTYNNTDELYHYGVLGMKWGKRNSNPAYAAYKKSKKDYRKARRDTIVPGLTGFGIKGISKYEKAVDKRNKAEINMITAKAKYKASKAKTAEKAEKAEFKTYRKEMNKSGLVNSAADAANGGRSKRIYDEMRAKKGKAYADKVQKSLEKKYVRDLVGGSLVLAGSLAATAYLELKD